MPKEPTIDTAVVERLIHHLSAWEEAHYACAFQTHDLELLAGTISKPHERFSHYIRVLKEAPGKSSDPTHPVSEGMANHADGRVAFWVRNRTSGTDATSVVYFDGAKSIEWVDRRSASVRPGSEEACTIGLPWTLLRFGATSMSPVLRASLAQGSSATEPLGSAGEFGVAVLDPQASADTEPQALRARIRFRLGARPDEDCITELEIRRGPHLATRCAITRHVLVDSVLLPSEVTFSRYLPGFGPDSADPLLVAHHIRIRYVDEAPDPAEILAAVEGVAVIHARTQNLFTWADLEAAMDGVAAAHPWGKAVGSVERRRNPVPIAEPALCPNGLCTWEGIDAWVDARLQDGTLRQRPPTGESHRLQLACAMVAKWLGRPARLPTVIRAAPTPEISIADGILLLESLGLPYVAVETTKQALARCRHPFVVLGTPPGKVIDAVAVLVSAGTWHEWATIHHLQKRDAGAIGDAPVTALVHQADARAGR